MVTVQYCRPDPDEERGARKEELLEEISERHGIDTEVVDTVRSGYGAGSVLLLRDGDVAWKVTYDTSVDFLERVAERGKPFLESVLEGEGGERFHT